MLLPLLRMQGLMFTVAEVAEKLNVSAKLVYALCGKGAIPHYRIGGRIRISSEQIAAYLEGQRHQVTPSAKPRRHAKLWVLDL